MKCQLNFFEYLFLQLLISKHNFQNKTLQIWKSLYHWIIIISIHIIQANVIIQEQR